MRLLVCGSRGWTNANRVHGVLQMLLDACAGDLAIIHGDARGVDRMAGLWAAMNCRIVLVCTADWDKHGKSAGPIRNQKMLSEGRPELVVGFTLLDDEGNASIGTMDMVNRAKKHNVPHILLTESGLLSISVSALKLLAGININTNVIYKIGGPLGQLTTTG